MGDIYYKLDRNSRADLMATVRRAAIEILEGPQEEWITSDEVSKRFPFFNKDWMKKYGYLLPRKRVEVIDKKGSITKCHWYYSRNKIQRMVRDDDILPRSAEFAIRLARVSGFVARLCRKARIRDAY